MKFTVKWLPDAEQELASIWLASSNRQAVTAAAFAIDQELEIDPANAGESRPDQRRIVIVAPLAVKFRVFVPKKLVFVEHVWSFRTRHS